MMQNTDEEIINNGRENLTKDQIIDYTYADIQTDEFDQLIDNMAPLKGRRKESKQKPQGSILGKENLVFKDFIKQVQKEEENTIV